MRITLMVLGLGILATISGATGLGDFSLAAQEVVGQAEPNGYWFQEPATEQARRIEELNWFLLLIITGIVAFVFALMAYSVIRFRAKANPEAASFSHNTKLEVVWTAAPIAILLWIGYEALPLLYYQDEIPETEFAIQVTGNQWNWTYNYLDHDGIEFTASVVPDSAFENADDREQYEGELSAFLGAPAKLNTRLLDTDYRLVLPVDTKIKLLITASDVIHSWTVPTFGVKMDAVPGRVNETWFEVEKTGTFYGQCSELCGKDHAFMPIAVEVVSKEEFARWVERAKENYATARPFETALGR